MTLRPGILLVDDLPSNLHMMCDALVEHYELSIATNGGDALTIGAEVRPDMVLLDVMMPVMDGFETLRRLRMTDWGQHIPVIMVTADNRSETEVQGLKLGADDFITKPVSVPAVKARVMNLLSASLLRRTLTELNQSLVRLTGTSFFQRACQLLIRSLGTDIAFVGRLRTDGRSVDVIHGWAVDRPLEPFTYALEGSPCAEVFKAGVVCYPDHVDQLFPRDNALAHKGIVSYAGSTLFDGAGRALGILVTLGKKPLPNLVTKLAPSMLSIFVDRMAAEIQRSESERSLMRAVQLLERDAKARTLIQSLAQSFIDVPIAALDPAIDEALGRIGEFLESGRSYLFRYDFVRAVCYNSHEWCAPGVTVMRDVLQDIPLSEHPEWPERHCQGLSLRIESVATLPEGSLKRSLIEQNIASLLAVPLMDQSECLGFVGVDFLGQECSFDKDDEFILSLLAGLLVTVLRRERLERNLVEQEHHFRTLANTGSALIWTCDTQGQRTYFA